MAARRKVEEVWLPLASENYHAAHSYLTLDVQGDDLWEPDDCSLSVVGTSAFSRVPHKGKEETREKAHDFTFP